MHTFDIIFGIVAAALVFLGIRRGLIEEIMRLAAIIVGFLCALLFYKQLVSHLSFLPLPSHGAVIVSFLVIFLCVVLAMVLIGKLIRKIINLTMLGWVDKLCGACIGGIKAIFIGWIFVIIISSIPFLGRHSFFKGSCFYSFFTTISPVLKTQVLQRVPQPKDALSNIPSMGDFVKKVTTGVMAIDSLGRTALSNKPSHPPQKRPK